MLASLPRVVLECAPDPAAGAEPEGDMARRLRLKNRQLQAEIAGMVALREDMFDAKVAKAEQRCAEALARKDEEHRLWRERHAEDLQQMRAAAVVMHNLRTHKERRMTVAMRREQGEFAQQLALVQGALERAEADRQQERQRLQQQFDARCAEFQRRLEELTRERAEEQDRSMALQRQLDAGRMDLELAADRERHQQREIGSLQEQLNRTGAEMKKLEEMLKRDKRVKAMQREKEMLEREVQEYIRFIVDESRLPPKNSTWDAGAFPRLQSALDEAGATANAAPGLAASVSEAPWRLESPPLGRLHGAARSPTQASRPPLPLDPQFRRRWRGVTSQGEGLPFLSVT